MTFMFFSINLTILYITCALILKIQQAIKSSNLKDCSHINIILQQLLRGEETV